MSLLQEQVGGMGPLVQDPNHAKFYSAVVTRDKLKAGDIALVGIPFEGLTINPVGGRGGPQGLRSALGFYRTYSAELDIDIMEELAIANLGDVDVEPMDYEETFHKTGLVIKEILDNRWFPIAFGGSHSVSEGILRAFSEHFNRNIGLVWLDAHPDTMEEYRGDKHYCGCPLIRLIEDGYVKPEKIVALGHRSFHNSKNTIAKAKELGITLVSMDEFREKGVQTILKETIKRVTNGTEAFYMSLDTDAIEGAFVPGTQAPCPGGFLPHEITKFVRSIAVSGCSGFDIVEFAPSLDVRNTTGSLLASLVLEVIAGVAYRRKR